MITEWLLLLAFAGFNAVWSVLNWRLQHRIEHDQADWKSLLDHAKQVRDEAYVLFNTAKKASETAVMEQEHKVCSICNRIVARHSTDETGQVKCVNCITDLAKKAG